MVIEEEVSELVGREEVREGVVIGRASDRGGSRRGSDGEE